MATATEFRFGGCIDVARESVFCTGVVIGSVAPNIVITGNGNTINGGRDFRVVGNGTTLFDCHHASVVGNGLVIDKTCSYVSATGNGIRCDGQHCVVNDSSSKSSWNMVQRNGARGGAPGQQSYQAETMTFSWSRPAMFVRTFNGAPGGQSYQSDNMPFINGRLTRTFNGAPGGQSYQSDNMPFINGRLTMPPLPPQPHAPLYPAAPAEPEPTLDDTAANEAVTCILCCERARATAIVPCGHSYACVTCVRASRPTECAICKRQIDSVVRVIHA